MVKGYERYVQINFTEVEGVIDSGDYESLIPIYLQTHFGLTKSIDFIDLFTDPDWMAIPRKWFRREVNINNEWKTYVEQP